MSHFARREFRALFMSCLSVLVFAASCGLVGVVAPLLGNIASAYLRNHGRDSAAESLDTLLQSLAANAPSPQVADLGAPLEIEIQILNRVWRTDRYELVPISDGDVLQGRATGTASDEFLVYLKPDEDCYLYVVNIDSTAWVTLLHPVDGVGRITQAGEVLTLPEGSDDVFALDEVPGKETFYFVASRDRRMDIEDAMRPFVGRSRPERDYVMRVDVHAEDVIEFGIESRTTGTATLSRDGETPSHISVEVLTASLGGHLTATRWFMHR